MLRPLVLSTLVFCSLSLISPSAHAESTKQARRQIQAEYDNQDAAMAQKDTSGAIEYMDPSFNGFGPNGGTPQTYQDRMAGLPMLFKMVKSLHPHTHIQKFVLHGRTAEVRSRVLLKISAYDPDMKRVRTVVNENISTDTWIKRPTGWMLLRRYEVSMKRLPEVRSH